MYANRHFLRFFGILVAVFFAATPTSAQCIERWHSGQGLQGLSHAVYSTTVYDDGTGPALYVGGRSGGEERLI